VCRDPTRIAVAARAPTQGSIKVPGGPLTEQDYRRAAEEGGYTGHIVVGTDLASVRLPGK